jgi:uncharacterized protein YgbK (DUF1537 family)
VIALDLTAAGDDGQWATWLTHALQRLTSAPPAAPIVVVTPAVPVTPAQDAVLMSRLTELATAVLQHSCVHSVVATGGSTVRSLCNRWNAVGLDLIDEIAPGVPLCIVNGGRFDGLTLVTKAGGFGDVETLVTIVEYCQTRKRIR